MRTLDAVILAGEKKGAIPVLGQNKAFLPFGEELLIERVIAALEKAVSISSVTVVGPKEKLERALEGKRRAKPVRFLEQGTNIFENIINGALSTFAGWQPGMTAADLKALPRVDSSKTVVMVTSDMPLLDPREVDAFIATAPLERADVVYGFTPWEILVPYEPGEGKPGIKFLYICLSDRIIRHANIALYRPLRLAPVMDEFVQIIYSVRYQRYVRNIIRAFFQILRHALNAELLSLFLLAEAASWCHNRGFFRLRDLLRPPLTQEWVDRMVSHLFQTPYATHLTIGPGLTLDVDDETSYRTFLARLPEWRELQERQLCQALDNGAES